MQQNLNLFDLLLRETYVGETLRDEDKILAIDILARLIVNTTLDREKGTRHD